MVWTTALLVSIQKSRKINIGTSVFRALCYQFILWVFIEPRDDWIPLISFASVIRDPLQIIIGFQFERQLQLGSHSNLESVLSKDFESVMDHVQCGIIVFKSCHQGKVYFANRAAKWLLSNSNKADQNSKLSPSESLNSNRQNIVPEQLCQLQETPIRRVLTSPFQQLTSAAKTIYYEDSNLSQQSPPPNSKNRFAAKDLASDSKQSLIVAQFENQCGKEEDDQKTEEPCIATKKCFHHFATKESAIQYLTDFQKGLAGVDDIIASQDLVSLKQIALKFKFDSKNVQVQQKSSYFIMSVGERQQIVKIKAKELLIDK